jgi:hypothetical protein
MSNEANRETERPLLVALAQSAHLAYTNALVGNPAPSVAEALSRMRDVRVGDLVLETTTYYRQPWSSAGLGYLMELEQEPVSDEENWDGDLPIPTEPVYYIRPLDGSQERVRWTNARFIALPPYPEQTGTFEERGIAQHNEDRPEVE